MIYNYYAKQDYYAYLSGGVAAWDLLLPNNIGLKKGDTVKVIETNNNGDETGRATSGTIVFNGVDGILTVNGNRDFYYINNITTSNMYTIYRATFKQTPGSDPVVTVLENTTGAAWAWSTIGDYQLSASSTNIVYASKTVVLVAPFDVSNVGLVSKINGAYEDIDLVPYAISGGLGGVIWNDIGIEIMIFP